MATSIFSRMCAFGVRSSAPIDRIQSFGCFRYFAGNCAAGKLMLPPAVTVCVYFDSFGLKPDIPPKYTRGATVSYFRYTNTRTKHDFRLNELRVADVRLARANTDKSFYGWDSFSPSPLSRRDSVCDFDFSTRQHKGKQKRGLTSVLRRSGIPNFFFLPCPARYGVFLYGFSACKRLGDRSRLTPFPVKCGSRIGRFLLASNLPSLSPPPLVSAAILLCPRTRTGLFPLPRTFEIL